jgi:ParB family chromosome partitioning protein
MKLFPPDITFQRELTAVEIRQIAVASIAPDHDQPRRQHSEESLQGLADSIKQHGLLHPITVSSGSSPGSYIVVTGERRWRAAGMAGLESIACIFKDVPSDERLTVQLIENLQREDLLPLEKARAINHVKTALHLTNREIARRLGISDRTVGYLLDLLDLPVDIGEAVVSSPNRPADGQLTEKHARFLKMLQDEPGLQTAVADRIRDDKLNSETAGKLVKALRKRPDQSEEILHTAADHLSKFFQDEAPEEVDDSPFEVPTPPAAKKILQFLPHLAGLALDTMSVAELRHIEDALISLRMAAESLLQQCKNRTGD